MLYAYYKPRKCEHLRFCHLELILKIILFLCGMLAQTSSNLSLLRIFWILFVEDFLGAVLLKCVLLYTLWETVCFKIIHLFALHVCLTF